MCVPKSGLCTTRRSRDAINNPLSYEHSEHWNKMANSNFRSEVFENRVHVWVLPLSLSQSYYGDRDSNSSACTLITVQIAHDFLSQNISIPSPNSLKPQDLPLGVLGVLINGIVDGNETHEKAMAVQPRGFFDFMKKKEKQSEDRRKGFFTVPDAIQVQRLKMHEIDYRSYSGDFISNLVTVMSMAVTSPYLSKLDRLPIVVSACKRAMCFIYDRPTNSIILLDTHMHFKRRAVSVLCVASFEEITDFIVSVTEIVFPKIFESADAAGKFEITCLMLTSLMSKVYKNDIFLPIKSVCE